MFYHRWHLWLTDKRDGSFSASVKVWNKGNKKEDFLGKVKNSRDILVLIWRRFFWIKLALRFTAHSSFTISFTIVLISFQQDSQKFNMIALTFALINSMGYNKDNLSQLMRLWYLSHRRPAKAQASLRIRAVSPESSLFAHIKFGRRRRVQPKIRHLAPLDVCACAFEEWVYGGRTVA